MSLTDNDDDDYYFEQLTPIVKSFIGQYRAVYEKGPRPVDLSAPSSVVPGTPMIIGLVRGMVREVMRKGRIKDYEAKEIADALYDLVGVHAMMPHTTPVVAHAAIKVDVLDDRANATLNAMMIYPVKRRCPDIGFGGYERTAGDQVIIPIDFIISLMREVKQTALPVVDPTLETRAAMSQTAKLWANLVFPMIEFLIANPTKGTGWDSYED